MPLLVVVSEEAVLDADRTTPTLHRLLAAARAGQRVEPAFYHQLLAKCPAARAAGRG